MLVAKSRFVIAIVLGVVLLNTYAKCCQLQVSMDQPPIILNIRSEIVYPSNKLGRTYVITVQNNEQLFMSCNNGGFKQNPGIGDIYLQCVNNAWRITNGVQYPLNSPIQCANNVANVAKNMHVRCGNNYGEEYAIGVELPRGFVQLMMVCYDFPARNPLYTLFEMTYHTTGSADPNRPQFDTDRTLIQLDNINAYYTKEGQQLTFTKLGTNIRVAGSTYLAKGHLMANNDFVWSYQQRATFHLINAVPQWQNCNNANWKAVENAVRKYAQNHGVVLYIFTGTYRIAQVANNAGAAVDLYLYVDNSGRHLMPVPELTWKLVYNPLNNANIVLFTINNPFKSTFVPICTNVLSSLNWLSIRANDPCHGFTYACLAQDVYNSRLIKQFPDLPYRGILN